jgi:2-polyprenyl-6-methoxyphenol hydroxylase-like FAD-dependent oxidoreductase
VSHDVLVVGAGPAGSVVAGRLAAAGARVALVGGAARAGWEGLSRRSLTLLAEEGLDGAPDIIDGPFARSGEWAGGRPVEGTEWLVERRALAAALRCLARVRGADDRCDAVASLEWHDGQWRGLTRAGGTPAAPLVIDARGRRGPERHGPLLLAVGRQFRRRAGRASGAPAEHGTHIHPIEYGWCWWAVRRDALWVQVVGEPRGGQPAMGRAATGRQAMGPPAAWIASAAAQIPALAQALDACEPDGDLLARPAHARLGCDDRLNQPLKPRDATRWRVGDAALALDPLSGQGVYEALRGARLVATAVQSVMRGGDAAAAQRFVAERQEVSWTSGVRIAAGFYRENAARGAFWSETATAYERLLPRAASDAPRIERRPVLCGDRILEREVIVTPRHPRGVWQVADVPLVSLKGYLESAEHATVTGAAAAVDRPAAAVASAIHWLQQTGMVARQLGPGIPLGG